VSDYHEFKKDKGKPKLHLIPWEAMQTRLLGCAPGASRDIAYAALVVLRLYQHGNFASAWKNPYVLSCINTADLPAVSRVMEGGLSKYEESSYRSVGDGAQRYLSAMLRHSLAAGGGELDPESGLPAIDHAYCNLFILFALSRMAMESVSVLQAPPGPEAAQEPCDREEAE
jgi:hypothetical protein